MRTATLPNLFYCYIDGVRICCQPTMLVLFRLLLIVLALIDDGKFISVYDYTWKLSNSLTIFHHVFVLLLRYNCD